MRLDTFYVSVIFQMLLCAPLQSAWADRWPPEMNILMTMAGKKMCDASIPDFAVATDESYKMWMKRHADQIEYTKKKFGEEKFYSTIETFSSEMAGKMNKSDLTSSCKSLSDWVRSPLD